MKLIHCVALGAVLLAEAILFQHVVAPRHTWIYPQWHDQVQYLTEAYRSAEVAQAGGWAAGTKDALNRISAQGALHGPAALVSFAVAGGPSRGAALAVNLVAFLLLQAATFFAARRVTGSPAVAWSAVALLIALHCPWSGQSASMVDFRLDWLSACTYGLALAAALASSGFRSTRWSLVFGAAVALAVIGRFLTAAYFAVAYALLLGWLCTQPDRLRRSARLLLSGLFAAALFGPVLWRGRQAIHDYYWLGHVSGAERALRDANAGFFSAVPWLLARLVELMGLPVLLLGLLAAALLWWQQRGTRTGDEPASSVPAHEPWAVVLAFLLAPLAVLAAHTLRAPQPVVVLLPAGVWLLVLACWRAGRRLPPGRVAMTSATLLLGAATITAVAVSHSAPAPATVSGARRINALVDYLCFRSQEARLAHPRIAVTRHLEGVDALGLDLLAYERHGRFPHFAQSLPTGLFAAPSDQVAELLASSDFVCLSRSSTAAPWPFDRQMIEALPDMLAWCSAHLIPVADLEIAGQTLTLFERPKLDRPEQGTDLRVLLATGGPAPGSTRAVPPAAPRFDLPARLVTSTRTPVQLRVTADYTPVRYRAAGLPAGVTLNPVNGVLQGSFPAAGNFPLQFTATNPAGTTTRELVVQVIEGESFTSVDVPASCVAGTPVEIRFEAFDASGKLNYLDLSDLPAGKALARLVPSERETQYWPSRHTLTLDTPGVHTLVLRFVRYDATPQPTYTFVDETREIQVLPP